MKDYYKILELEKTATLVDIKKAFRRLSKTTHPDKSTGDKEKFQEINEAYQTLSDPAKKQAYDTGTTYHAPQTPIINPIGIRVAWTLEDIKKGKTIKVKFQRASICKTCNGVGSLEPSAIIKCKHCHGAGVFSKQEHTPFGFVMMEQTCMHCRGAGESNSKPCTVCHGQKMVNELAEETIHVPSGTCDSFIVKNKGHHTIHGDSDLVIYFEFKNTNELSLYQGILQKSILVDFFDALLGKEQIILLGDKSLKVSLPKESKTGSGFRLTAAYYGVDVIVFITVPYPTIKQTKEYILGLFQEDSTILPAITKRVNESLK